MYISALKIIDGENIIRNIPFHKGLNLIVDETSSGAATESGNNVGKTTVLRLIDFCLGGKGENIYKDSEFKTGSNNVIVEKYLKENDVRVRLTLKKDLSVRSSTEIVIERNFLAYKNKVQTINGESYSNEEFPKKLKELVFGSDENKPTFKQIISKNIRDEKNRLQNAVYTLHPTTTKEEYEALFLFWLGITVDNASRKQKIQAEIKLEENLQKRLRREGSYSLIEQSLIVIAKNIHKLEARKDSFNLNENYEEELETLNSVKKQLNQLSTTLSQLEYKRQLIIDSRTELENELVNVDVDQIRSLYQEAGVLIPNLQRTFEETLDFHNQMVKEREHYISKELPEVEEQIKFTKRKIVLLRLDEASLTESLNKSGAIEELQKIISQLNLEYERKGHVEEKKRLWDQTISKQEALTKELDSINQGIDSKDQVIQERVTVFNSFFTEISEKLYGEQFILSAFKDERAYQLNISSLSGNLGTGKKKGQIAAFDFSYIKFAELLGIEHLNFILHDQIENVHDNQINSLLTEIVSGINCQYILPVLRDKLPEEIDVDQYVVLNLSQSDKLFRR